MAKEEIPETEENVEKLVRRWVRNNYTEFNEGGKPDGKPLYRENIFARCEKFQNAPDEYLKMWMKTFPDIVKWYLNILQTVFAAGLIAISSALLFYTLNSFSTWIKGSIWIKDSIWILKGYPHPAILLWIIPMIILVAIGLLALLTNKKSQSKYLSSFIQNKSGILQNLKEIHIETYYISKILEIREAAKKEKSMVID